MNSSTPQPLNNSTFQPVNVSTSKDVLIRVENISKKYCRYLKDSMVYGLADIGRNAIGLSSHSDHLRENEFWSVDDVSFEVKRGETLGLVGANGSGKTTILKMLNGIFWPDKGKITIRGSVGALIAVGAGFHPLLTGRENIYVNGAILGMSKQEVDKKFDAIVDFAEIGDFLDSPVKHYSSGMYVRLGFAIAVHSRCDILLIDEVLAVGDIKFQAKCIEKIKEKGQEGVTKIFVSHNLDSVQLLCKNTVYLSKGKIHRHGPTSQVLAEFKSDVSGGRVGDVDARFGTRDVEITKVEFLDRSQRAKQNFNRGERFQVRISFDAKKLVKDPSFSVCFTLENGPMVLKKKTRSQGYKIEQIQGAGDILLTIEALSLPVGKYWLSVSCWDSEDYLPYDCQEKVYPLIVEAGADIPGEWEIHEEKCNNG